MPHFRIVGNIPNFMTNLLNRKGSDAKPTGETCAELYERLNVGRGMTLRNFQERFNGKNEVRFSMRREVSAKEVAIMEGLYPPIKEKLKRVDKAAVSTSESNVVPGATSKKVVKKVDWDIALVRLILGLGVVGHAVLIVYECWYLWGNGGAIAGTVVFALILSAVILIRKNASLESAKNILLAVWVADAFAIPVHEKALYHAGSNAFGAGISEYGTACLAVVIAGFAGTMVYFYRQIGLKK